MQPPPSFRAPRRGVRFAVMPGSLRLRLPAVFLLGIVLAGLVSALIAVQLFSGYTRDRSYEELGREARGIARLYGDAALRAAEERLRAERAATHGRPWRTCTDSRGNE